MAAAAAAEAALSAKLHVSIPVVAEDDSDVAAAAAAFAMEAERGARGVGFKRDSFRDSKRQVYGRENATLTLIFQSIIITFPTSHDYQARADVLTRPILPATKR
jgi:hypothetical protein